MRMSRTRHDMDGHHHSPSYGVGHSGPRTRSMAGLRIVSSPLTTHMHIPVCRRTHASLLNMHMHKHMHMHMHIAMHMHMHIHVVGPCRCPLTLLSACSVSWIPRAATRVYNRSSYPSPHQTHPMQRTKEDSDENGDGVSGHPSIALPRTAHCQPSRSCACVCVCVTIANAAANPRPSVHAPAANTGIREPRRSTAAGTNDDNERHV